MAVSDRLAALREDAERWLDLCGKMVGVDSGPGDADGHERMATLLTGGWADVGLDVEWVGSRPQTLLARRRAEGPRILMIGHYDTVFPSGTADQRPFTIQGGRATGPGSSDMKAGLVVQLAAMASTVDERCDVTVLVNGDEESGSVGSRRLIEEQAAVADVALVFEPGEPDGAVVLGRPGVRRFRVTTSGRAAHTGVDPEAGRNAIEGMAHIVVEVQDLGRRGDLGTVTVSQIVGGTRPNIVPDHAEIVVDGRIASADAGRRLRDALGDLATSVPVPDVTGEVEDLEDRPPFTTHPVAGRLAAVVADLAAACGVRVEARAARGSSDGNFTSGMGVPTLDGLGPPGAGLHTSDEWFEVDGLFTRAAVVASLLEYLGKQDPGVPARLVESPSSEGGGEEG